MRNKTGISRPARHSSTERRRVFGWRKGQELVSCTYMDTKQKISTKNEIDTLKQEVRLLRSFVISMLGKDMEGEYRPEFIEELLKASSEDPTHHYTGAGSLLKQLKEV